MVTADQSVRVRLKRIKEDNHWGDYLRALFAWGNYHWADFSGNRQGGYKDSQRNDHALFCVVKRDV